MEIKSYSNLYLGDVVENIGIMFEYAVNTGINPNVFWNTFINSNVAKQIEKGNLKYLTSSAMDYLSEIYNNKIDKNKKINKNKYYWAGYVIAHLQYETGYSFYEINKLLSIEEVLNLYPTLHETDITKFFDIAKTYFDKEDNITNIRKIREASGLSQSELSRLSHVELRSIQMYEQKRNNINKAQVETLYKLSKTLGCNIEDLLEK